MDAMTIFDDYESYMSECEELIEKLTTTQSVILIYFVDVKRVCDFLYNKYKKNNSLDDDEIEIFDLGFGYLSNIFHDLNIYYEDYFGKNVAMFNYYSPLISNQIYLDDYKSHLESEELLTDELKTAIDDVTNQIEEILSSKKPFSQNESDNMMNEVLEHMPYRDVFRPVPTVFQMISEEFRLF